MTVLKTVGLSSAYGVVPVINEVALEVAAGEVVTLLGRNGVGKTTLLKTIIGLLRPTAGTVELAGNQVGGMAPHAIARLGVAFVPQGRGIFSKLSVRENLVIGTRARSDGQSKIPDRVFSYFPRLQERLEQAGGTLSGGEQQMLAIGRALCSDPKILLLDEPSEGIQPNIVEQIGDLIRELVDSTGMAVLLVEQNLDLAIKLSDRSMFMDKGRIMHYGSANALKNQEILQQYLAL